MKWRHYIVEPLKNRIKIQKQLGMSFLVESGIQKFTETPDPCRAALARMTNNVLAAILRGSQKQS